MAGEEITGSQINDVLRLVKSMAPTGDAQLSILARAFVVACKDLNVDGDVVMSILADYFQEPVNLVALEH